MSKPKGKDAISMREIVSDSRSCTGCSACSQVCPMGAVAMAANDEGFLYPLIDEDKCSDCGLCIRTCPVNRALGVAGAPMGTHKGADSAGNVKGDGSKKKAFACYAKDDDIRDKSSSGGIFSQLAEKTLEKNGVVFGAGFDSDFRVRHSHIEGIDDLDMLRRSKYVQSDMEDTFRDVNKFLREGRHVLFCGTPCQTAGLSSYLGGDHERLLICDLACYGVPSPKVWSMYLEYLENKYASKVKSVSFRNKSGGWKNNRMDIAFENGDRYLVETKKELYFMGFSKNIFNRTSCFDCKFRVWNSSADITLADFWGIERMGGIIEDDNKGVSLTIIHSPKGEEALSEIADNVRISPCDLDEAVKYNPRLVSSAAEPAGRKAFFADMAAGYDFDRLRKKYMDNTSMKYKMKCMLKRMLGRG
jgi:coenzyme F420-reducing hydrogenase beta subunit